MPLFGQRLMSILVIGISLGPRWKMNSPFVSALQTSDLLPSISIFWPDGYRAVMQIVFFFASHRNTNANSLSSASTLPESMVGTWTATVVNYPGGGINHWPVVYEFTPCPMDEGEVCGWTVSCSLDYVPGQVTSGGRQEMTFLGIEGSSYTFLQGNITSETQYLTPLGSGDSLAIEGYLTGGEYPGTWDTYALLRRVGTPGAANSKWRDSVGSGETCPSTG